MTHAEALVAIEKVRSAVYGREVQQAIYDSLMWCLDRASDLARYSFKLQTMWLTVENQRLCQVFNPDFDLDEALNNLDWNNNLQHNIDIRRHLQQIKEAFYGGETRQTVHDILKYCLEQGDADLLERFKADFSKIPISIDDGQMYITWEEETSD